MAGFQDVLHLPVRSISLPSRLQPSSLKQVSELKKLKSSCCSSSWTDSETIQSNMTRLAEIFVSVQELVNSPLTHQALRKSSNGRFVEEALDGSMAVIDACSYARELVLAMREQIQHLQSTFRRNRSPSSSSCVEKQIQGFLSFRKKAKRDTVKHLRQLKKLLLHQDSSSSLETASCHMEIVKGLLQEVNQICCSIMKSVLAFLSMVKTGARNGIGGWSVVSRLIEKSSSPQKPLTEVESVVSCLLLRGQMKKTETVKMAEKSLETLDSCIGGFDQNLEGLFKGLIQYRVSLLNVITF